MRRSVQNSAALVRVGHCKLGCQKWPFPFRFSEQNPQRSSYPLNSCYLPSSHRHADQKYCIVQTPKNTALAVSLDQSCSCGTPLTSCANIVWGRMWFPNQNVVSAGVPDAGGWRWLWLGKTTTKWLRIIFVSTLRCLFFLIIIHFFSSPSFLYFAY
jgi:hypothetical protein